MEKKRSWTVPHLQHSLTDQTIMNTVCIFSVLFIFGECYSEQRQKVDPIVAALNSLQDFLLRTDPPKGTPFPKVPGPKTNEKVFRMVFKKFKQTV